MKEIIALHEKLVAQTGDSLPEEGIDFSREDAPSNVEILPEELRAEIDTLRTALNAVIPDHFDYNVLLGDQEEGPFFGLEFDRHPAGSSAGDDFDATRSLVEQLRSVDWSARQATAVESRQSFEKVIQLLERVSGPLTSAKVWQKRFREEAKDFVREKRRLADKVHVLTWEDVEGVMEFEFDDGDKFRSALPSMISGGDEIITVVAAGKPLPIERIDRLKAEAQRTLQERLKRADASLDLSLLDDPEDAASDRVEEITAAEPPMMLEDSRPGG